MEGNAHTLRVITGEGRSPFDLYPGGYAGEYPGNELVTVSDWAVTYSGSQLSVSCKVTPKKSSNAVSYLYVSAFSSHRARRVQYCSSSSCFNGMDVPSGAWQSCFASTQLFDPKVNGKTVTSVISGFVKTEMGSCAIYLARDFDVTQAVQPATASAVG